MMFIGTVHKCELPEATGANVGRVWECACGNRFACFEWEPCVIEEPKRRRSEPEPDLEPESRYEWVSYSGFVDLEAT